jgi:hypothetical protein
LGLVSSQVRIIMHHKGICLVVAILAIGLACTEASAATTFTFSFDETGNGILSDGNSVNNSTVTGALPSGSPYYNWDGSLNNQDVPLVYDLSSASGTAATEFKSIGQVATTGGWVEVTDSNGLSDWIKFAGNDTTSSDFLVEVFSGTWNGTTHTGSEVLTGNANTWGGVPSVATVDGIGQPVQTSNSVIENSSGVASYTPQASGYTFIQSNVSHTGTSEQGFLGGTGNSITYVLTSFDAPGSAAPEATSIAVWSLLGVVGLAYGYRKSRKIG